LKKVQAELRSYQDELEQKISELKTSNENLEQSLISKENTSRNPTGK
jgi:hypothetical protein